MQLYFFTISRSFLYALVGNDQEKSQSERKLAAVA